MGLAPFCQTDLKWEALHTSVGGGHRRCQNVRLSELSNIPKRWTARPYGRHAVACESCEFGDLHVTLPRRPFVRSARNLRRRVRGDEPVAVALSDRSCNLPEA